MSSQKSFSNKKYLSFKTINPKKIGDIEEKIAQSYLLEKRFPFDIKWQIDILAIEIDLDKRKAKLRHI